MQKRIGKYIHWIIKYIDWVIITVCCTTWILSLFDINSNYSEWIVAILSFCAFCYIARAVVFFIKRPLFDWHLINGHFLRKVCCLILLMPFVLAGISTFFIDSPKELAYEEQLYECKDNGLPCEIRHKQESPNLFWSTYFHFVDPGNQHMTTTQNGRAWSAFVAILGIFLLNGLLISSIISWIDSRKEKWLKGEIKYPWFLRRNKHYVIIGGNSMVHGFVRQIFENIKNKKTKINQLPYILIQTSRDVEKFRRELFSTLSDEQQKLIIIYYGNRVSEKDIKDLFIENAEEVYIIGEDIRTDDTESYHDTMNIECLKLISSNIQNTARFNKKNQLVCRVMFEYQISFNILQATDIDGAKIDFQPFNHYETWAQNILICQELKNKDKCNYLPLEGFDGITSRQDKFVHLVIVGLSRMGAAIAIEAAHLAHYPNFETNKKHTRITFIDASMEQEKHFFMGRFKELFNVARYRYVPEAAKGIYNDHETYRWHNPLKEKECESPYFGDYLGEDFVDIEWEFLNGPIENPFIQQYLADAAANSDAKLTIAICLPENNKSIAAAAYLPDSVYESDSTLQVLVYQRLNDDLLRLINQNKRYHGKLKAFGMTSLCYNRTLHEMAEYIAGEVDKAYDQYAWENLLLRHKSKGMTDNDYDKLSGNLYTENQDKPDRQEHIKTECTEWIEHNLHKPYEQLKNELKFLQRTLRENCSGENNHQPEIAGKAHSAKMWSNRYNVYSMWTKFRCIRAGSVEEGPFDPETHDFDQSMLEQLGKMEHNRWIVEQLLLRYRPLKKDEQEKAQITDLYSSVKEKNKYKKEFAHLDICANDRLVSIDYDICRLDKKLIEVLPKAYRQYLKEQAKQE